MVLTEEKRCIANLLVVKVFLLYFVWSGSLIGFLFFLELIDYWDPICFDGIY